MTQVDNNKEYSREANILAKYNFIACGYEKLSVTGTVTGLVSIPADARYMEIRVESDITASVPLRYLLLGGVTVPSATDGLALNHLDFLDISGTSNIINFRVIRTVAGNHTLHVQYYR